jgi:cation:H+ antiporter
MIIFWIIVFVVSLTCLVKGSDWLVESAEKIGLFFGLSPFIIGVTIVGFGTSFPELISSLFAAFNGATEIVVANAIGSNIANILLIIGVSAIISKKLFVSKSLIDLDLPLLSAGTILMLMIVWDKQVTFFEALLMLLTYGIYLLYTVSHNSDEEGTDDGNQIVEVLPSRLERRGQSLDLEKEVDHPKLLIKDFVFLILGIFGLVFGAKYLIDSLINISSMLNIATGVIAITAVALGTSLPELFVSARAALKKKSEVALGNIFGSNVFNALVVIGLPGLFRTLKVDDHFFNWCSNCSICNSFIRNFRNFKKDLYLGRSFLFIFIYFVYC